MAVDVHRRCRGLKATARSPSSQPCVAGALVFTQQAGSRWLWVAAALGVVCVIVGIADLAAITNNGKQEIFGREVELIKPGWGSGWRRSARPL